jgi:glycosyltransferase involved in cell wall biosynthesis
MKYPHTGLFHFCHHLGTALKQEVERLDGEICFYIPESARNQFGPNANVIIQKSLHKFMHPSMAGYQIWHSTYQGTNYFPRSKKIKKVITVHDLNFLYNDNKSVQKKERELEKLQRKLDQADAIVAISNFALNDMKAHLSFDHKKSTVIYNGCNFSENSKSQAPLIKPTRPFLYTIGTITEKKNFHVLPALLKTFDGVLIISGITQSSEYKQKIMDEAKKHGVQERVLFTGSVSEEEKMWYMENCELFVFPSLAEGFGLPVVEAMYLGTPVLLSRHTSLPEIGGDVANYFDSFEPEEMGSVLNLCFQRKQDSSHKLMLRERSLFFNWQNVSKEYYSIYKGILY